MEKKNYHLYLSMGHDTNLFFYINVSAESAEEALAIAQRTAIAYWGNQAVEEVYKTKGVRYSPYYFFEKGE